MTEPDEPEPLPEPAVEPTTPVPRRPPGSRPLLTVAGAAGYRARWRDLQAAFLDDPRAAVDDADQLVVEVVDELAAELNRARDDIAATWRDDPGASTEALRVVLRRYRDVVDQLLPVAD